MLLFAIYFPTRFALDQRRPWLKYLILVPALAAEAAYWAILVLWNHDIDAARQWRTLVVRLYFADFVAQMICISVFFGVLGAKMRMEAAPDDRRRLRILLTGAEFAFGPMFLIVLYALAKGNDIFEGVCVAARSHLRSA